MNVLKQKYLDLQYPYSNTHLYKTNITNKTETIEHPFLCIPTMKGKRHIAHMNILFCKGNGSYSIIYAKNLKKVIISKVLKWSEYRLPSEQFIRVHHSYLVNKNAILNFHYAVQSSITLIDGTIIPVSRSRKNYVKTVLTQ